jgi:hypothetical protein
MFGAQVDAIEYWEKQFQRADEQVRQLRKKGKFEATHVAFVTFENATDAVSRNGMPREMVADEAANGLPGGALPAPFRMRDRARTRTARRRVEQYRHDAARGTGQTASRNGSHGPLATLLDS